MTTELAVPIVQRWSDTQWFHGKRSARNSAQALIHSLVARFCSSTEIACKVSPRSSKLRSWVTCLAYTFSIGWKRRNLGLESCRRVLQRDSARWCTYFVFNLIEINQIAFLGDLIAWGGELSLTRLALERCLLTANLSLNRFIGSLRSILSSSPGVYWSKNSSMERNPPPTLILILSFSILTWTRLLPN